FNRDGKLDLAVADLGPSTQRAGTVSVLLGNGDGTFQVARTFAVGNTIWSVAVGDFNGDGKLDLAVPDGGANSVSVLLGNGDGTFQAALNFGAGLGPVFVAVDDFNGDGKRDMAVANYYFPGTVSVLINNTATAPSTFTLTVSKAGTGSGTVTSGDGRITCGAT